MFFNDLDFTEFPLLCFRSCVSERKTSCYEDQESELFIEVECFNVEPVLGPAPEGLSQQQVRTMFYQDTLHTDLSQHFQPKHSGFTSEPTGGQKVHPGVGFREREELPGGAEANIRGIFVVP